MKLTPDVVVIGAGVIGCAVAHELARRGAQVQIIDRRGVGRGASQASAGVLAPYIEGHDCGSLLDLAVRSLDLYDGFVDQIQEDAGTSVLYARSGTLEVAADEEAVARLTSAATRHAARGIRSTLLNAASARELEPPLTGSVLGGLLVPDHGFVAAADLTTALERAAAARGASFVLSRGVRRVAREDDRIRVETDAGTISASAVVLAAGSWSGQIEIADAPALPVRPVRGQLLQLAWPGQPLARVIWGAQCYLVPWPDGTLLVGATVEEVGFDERATAAGVRDLLDAACDLVPRAWQAGFVAARAGLRPATPDELPIIGPSRRVPGLIYATGHYRNGVLLAPLTATLVADLILEEREDPALAATAPERFGEY